MGCVWRAEDLLLGVYVAVKVLEPGLANGPNAVAPFAAEVLATSSVRHPNVVRLLDEGSDGRLPFLVLELLEGETLAERLQRERSLGMPRLLPLFRQLCSGLQAVHDAGFVHADLKPDNVFLTGPRGAEQVKLFDFGVAVTHPPARTAVGAGVRARTRPLLGTPAYMSPEQLRGDSPLDPRSDLWSLAVIAYECVLGRRPFHATDLQGLVAAITALPAPVPSRLARIPGGFDAWFARGVARLRDERFDSALAAADALATLCSVAVAGAGARPACAPALERTRPITAVRDRCALGPVSRPFPLAPSGSG